MQPEDEAIHRWYRFVLSFPPHLVQEYLDRFEVGEGQTVLDPFCGTGTTLVQAKASGVNSVGIESNPMAHFASSVKVDWSGDPDRIRQYAEEVVTDAAKTLAIYNSGVNSDLPSFASDSPLSPMLRSVGPQQSELLLKDSISPLPLHRALVLLEAIDSHGDELLRRYGRLALAHELVHRIGNLKFGPEVGIGRIKHDVPVVRAWTETMAAITDDLRGARAQVHARSRVFRGDARDADQIPIEPASVDAVITSPPYPNEKDYTRTTRLESVILGFIRNRADLRALKGNLIRSNTRGVYKTDRDDREVAGNAAVEEIASTIEKRRIELNKTSGFERMYPRVTKLYFGGMSRHLASMRSLLRPGASLAYVVGDQASYLRVMIRTGRILADIAESLGYKVESIDLFRTRLSTVTGEQLREEVVVLKWPGHGDKPRRK